MCGIGGVVWNKKPSRAIRTALGISLAVLNDSRGGKGYGICIPDNPNSKQVIKGTTTFANFIGKRGSEWSTAERFFLHTRFPSKGDVCWNNSHPFRIGPIIGAHNGCISNHDELNKEHKRRFPVDSMHFFAHLAEGKTFKDIHGYGALEWFDTRDGEIRVVWFNNGDLVGSEIKDIGVVWSSDRVHLNLALKGAGITDAKPVYLRTDQVYIVKGDGFYEDSAYGKIDVGSYFSTSRWQDGNRVSTAGSRSRRNLVQSNDYATPTTRSTYYPPNSYAPRNYHPHGLYDSPAEPTSGRFHDEDPPSQFGGFWAEGIWRPYIIPIKEQQASLYYGHWDSEDVRNRNYTPYVEAPKFTDGDYYDFLDEKWPNHAPHGVDKSSSKPSIPVASVLPLSEYISPPVKARDVDETFSLEIAPGQPLIQTLDEDDSVTHLIEPHEPDPFADDAPSGFLDDAYNEMTWQELTDYKGEDVWTDEGELVSTEEALKLRELDLPEAETLEAFVQEMEAIQDYREERIKQILQEVVTPKLTLTQL